MEKYQAKSPCCGEKVNHFGSRRRQCVACKKTWRIRKKKVGRKRKRVSLKLAESFFKHEISSLACMAVKKKVSNSFMQSAMIKSRDLLIKKTLWPTIPEGELLLIADAVVEMVEGVWRTVYLTLVRPILGSTAFIIPPLILDGGESPQGWHEAFSKINLSIMNRIKAVVCDGHRGILLEARDRRWVIQRCQFHFLARIQSRRSRFATARHKDEAFKIFHHADIVLKSKNEKEMLESLNILEEIGWISKSKEIRSVLKGFVNNYKDFRSYITYPELNLPATNNTAESLASMIGHLKIRMRGFPTMNSFTKWITAFLKFRQIVKCNKYQPS